MDYLTNDTELTAVADAIREKCETTDPLEWPDGFIQAIEDCETGGPELEWLWGNQITNTMSDTIDSTDDAYAGPILSLGVDGVSTQVITTGKNLLDEINNIVRGYFYDSTEKIEGGGTSIFAPVTEGETYTLSGGNGNRYTVAFTDVLPAVNVPFVAHASNLHTFTVPSGANYVVFYIDSTSNKTPSGYQLELGSTATAYEPYTGGKPSPSPDYPQDILSVEPRNILPSTVYQLAENITVVANSAYRSMYCKVDPNTTYTVSRTRVLGNRFGVYTTTVEPAAGVALTLIKSPTENTDILSYTFTTPANAEYAFFYLANNGADVSDSEMQLEKGSVAHSYGCSLALEVHGKNLLNPEVMLDQAPWHVVPIYAPVGTVLTMSTNCPMAATSGLACYFRLPNENQGSSTQVLPTHPVTRTVPDDVYVEIVQRRVSGEDSFANYEWQIELGSTATAYEPYQGQSVSLYDGTLRSLPDGTKDELHLTYLKPSKDHEGWAWYSRELVQRVDAYTFPANCLNAGPTDLGDGWYRYAGYNAIMDAYDNVSGLCDKAKYKIDSTEKSYHVYTTKGNNAAVLAVSQASTVEAVQAEFAGGTLLHACTPTTTQLDPIELPIMPSENATVWCDGGSAQPTFMLEYIQNANIVISRLEDTIADLATS